MGKCIAYTAGAITFMGIGALITGVTLYFVYPNMTNGGSSLVDNEPRFAVCQLKADGGFAEDNTALLTFNQTSASDPITISGTIPGLSPGLHGFHIHEFGVFGFNCTSTGGHYDPEDNPHAGPTDALRHVGDLGNIEAKLTAGGSNTVASVQIEDNIVSLYGDMSVAGRAIVVHQDADDLVSAPSGNAGRRVACCTIVLTDEQ